MRKVTPVSAKTQISKVKRVMMTALRGMRMMPLVEVESK